MVWSIRRIGAAFLYLLCVAAAAQIPSPGGASAGGEISLAQAIDTALRRNPELIASSYELSAAQARLMQAGVRPNPTIGLELENVGGTGTTSGTQVLETTLSLGQVVELGGKRQGRLSVAKHALDTASIRQRAQQLDVLAEVTRRFIEIAASREHVNLAQRTAELAAQSLQRISARVEAARSPLADESRARIALIGAQLDLSAERSELSTARHALAALWGDPAPMFSAIKADFFALPALPDFESLLSLLENNPDFVVFASEARLLDAQVRLAKAVARPNLSFSVGVRHLQAAGDTALVGGFQIDLPVFDRNRGAIREATVRRAQSDAERRAATVRARATLFALFQQAKSSRQRSDVLRNEAIPLARKALEQTRSGYSLGRFSYLELATAQQALLVLQRAAIDAAADHHRMRAEIERLTSEPLTAALPTGAMQ